MALDFSKLNFLSKMGARSRMFTLVGVVIGFVLIVYFGSKYLSNGGSTTGASRVASGPSIQSVQGGDTLTPEYQRALVQSTQQAAQNAQMSGGSALPTVINTGMQSAAAPSSACNIICSDQSANVKNNLDDWVRQGKISPELAAQLQQLADQNGSVEDYASELARLVKEGKLTPEQARALLDQYKKQHSNALLQDSAKTMDDMIKSGELPLDVANQLLAAQKSNASPSDYAAELQDLVRQGKLSPEAAARLLAQYSQQHAKEVTMQSIAILHEMGRNGELIPDVLSGLIELENRMVPMDLFTAEVQKYVAAGKMTPGVAKKVIDEFKMQKDSIGPSGTIDGLLKKAEAAAYGELDDLEKSGQMAPEVANLLRSLIQKNVSMDDYQKTITQLVQQNKITPAIAKLKMADYQEVKGLRDMAARLSQLQANNGSNADYAEELKRQVQAGVLTPEQAAALMQEYQASTAKAIATGILPTTPGAADFAKLQQNLQEGGATQSTVSSDEFATAQVQSQQETAQDRLNRLSGMMNTMAGQASQLIASWNTTPMVHKAGTPDSKTGPKNGAPDNLSGSGSGGSNAANGAVSTAPVLIKAGTVLFGVLETAVNSDYPDTPVMVTIVDGPRKGAKLLGKLVTAKGVAGQMDRVSLNFTLMNEDSWPKSKAVSAFAIDPDTARTVLASNVDYHYLQRFGAIMATSFVQGYANAITSSAATTTTGIFGTSTTYPQLSPSQKLATAVGQIGQSLGSVTQGYTNIPPTVKVDSGVSLGILFMTDVTQ